jgi:hypothetical protein
MLARDAKEGTGSSVFNRKRRRSTVARDTPSAAQTAAIMPLTGAIVATASVKARRRPASSGSPEGPQDGVDGPRGISVP